MTDLLRQVISEIEKLPASQQNAIAQRLPWSLASRLMAELKAQHMFEKEYRNRQAFVLQVDKLRTRLLETYGEFSDSVDLIREDRSR
ncbi:MAG: hypothetical protein QNJ51_21940 [Calothrix sp. MO_167.B12]|nr:hypothetical protein [Calothrix sp. MO_167.B12]